MTTSKKKAPVIPQRAVDDVSEVTVRDVERLQLLHQILGDPRVRVEVSHGHAQQPTVELPASSRFQITPS